MNGFNDAAQQDGWRTVAGVLTVEVFGVGVLHIDCNHFPISLALVDHGEDAQHLDPDHVATGAHLRGDVVSEVLLKNTEVCQ